MNKTIAYITDTHLDEDISLSHGVNPRQNLKRIFEDLDARGIREVVFGGDIGEASSYRWLFDSLEKYQWRITLGNHDRLVNVKPYLDRPVSGPELYYSEEAAPFTYIFLDSSADEVSTSQCEWLEGRLKSGGTPLIFIHHPILSIDTAVDRIFPLKGREKLRQLLILHQRPVYVFTGHYHLADEQVDENISQFVAPAASFQLKRAAEMEIHAASFGYRIITLEDEQVSSETISFRP